ILAGITFHELLYGKRPFERVPEDMVQYSCRAAEVTEGKVKKKPTFPLKLSGLLDINARSQKPL
ncbi:MAG: hypothetical protein VXW28_06180, partial [Candidatus Thermoplasmatota archaeon]|nr:hypothetical protein [Candidatus Thermoplasmatota archaeon]